MAGLLASATPVWIENQGDSGLILLLGAIQFNICLLISHAITPGYSIVNDDISLLGNASLSPAFLIFDVSAILAGIAIVACGLLMLLAEKSGKAVAVSVLMVILGIGVTGVGAFPSGNPYALAYNPHNDFADIAFVFSGLAALAKLCSPERLVR